MALHRADHGRRGARLLGSRLSRDARASIGLNYDFQGTWGVSRGTFEALTLGTLAVIVLLAVVGYATGRGVREKQAVDIPIADNQDSEIAAIT